jgi:Flp pilus assembly protein TadD
MAAKASYERASTMYPNAQSPRLALSQLARQSGDRDSALRALQPIADLPQYERLRRDPWWTYYDVR